MAGSKISGYVLLFVGVFLLGLAIPLIDLFLPRAAEEGGMMVNVLFVALVVGGGILFLALAWQSFRRSRR